MNGPTENEGLLARLRQNERLQQLTGGRPELAIFGAPIALLVIVIAVIAIAVSGGGSADDREAVGTATSEATSTAEATPTPGANAGLKTPIAFDPGAQLTLADLAMRGAGEPARGEFLGERITIPRIGVDAPFTYKMVPSNGHMPDPNSWNDVAYYDFSNWPGLGGLPNAGGNVVVAGHVDYINHGPAVFWDLHDLEAGDIIQIHLRDGTVVEYAVEFNKFAEVGEADWTAVVAGTADESITLITCTGEFSAGHYNQRQVVWGRRVS